MSARCPLYREERNGYLFIYNDNYWSNGKQFPYMIHIYKLKEKGRLCVYYKALEKPLAEQACKLRFTEWLTNKGVKDL